MTVAALLFCASVYAHLRPCATPSGLLITADLQHGSKPTTILRWTGEAKRASASLSVGGFVLQMVSAGEERVAAVIAAEPNPALLPPSSVSIVDLKDGRVRPLLPAGAPIFRYFLSSSPDGGWLGMTEQWRGNPLKGFSGTRLRTIRLEERRQFIASFPGALSKTAWSPDGSRLAVLATRVVGMGTHHSSKYYALVLPSTLTTIDTVYLGTNQATSVSWSADGRKLAVGTYDSIHRKVPAQLITLTGGRQRRLWSGPPTDSNGYIADIHWSRTTIYLLFVTTQEDYVLVSVNAKSGVTAFSRPLSGDVYAAFCARGLLEENAKGRISCRPLGEQRPAQNFRW